MKNLHEQLNNAKLNSSVFARKEQVYNTEDKSDINTEVSITQPIHAPLDTPNTPEVNEKTKNEVLTQISLAAMKYITEDRKIYINDKLKTNIETLISNLPLDNLVDEYLDNNGALQDKLKEVVETMNFMIDKELKDLAKEKVENEANVILEKELIEYKDIMSANLKRLNALKPKQVLTFVDHSGNKITQDPNKIYHEQYETTMKLLANKKHVFLVGPSGAGKNVMAEQIAEDLKREFYFVNAVTDEMQLTGYKDATGQYHTTPLMEAVEKGGVFFFDEVDASVPEALITINALLANGYLNHPVKGRVYMHEECLIIAAGNTIGLGATSQYNGRSKIDAATLNRFAVVEFDYSPKVEQSIVAANGTQEAKNMYELFLIGRRYNNDIEGDIIWGTRSLKSAIDMLGLFTIDEILSMFVFQGRDMQTKKVYISEMKNRHDFSKVTENTIQFDEIFEVEIR